MVVRTVHFSDSTWEQSDPLLRKIVVEGQHATTTRYSFEPGGRFPRHRHPQEQMTYVISGDFSFVIEGKEHRLEPDSMVVLSPNVIHSGKAGASGAEIVAVVAPPRKSDDIEMLEED
jgi:quercetin dioxygenase-like cupin family protein